MHASDTPNLQTRLSNALAGQYTIERQLGQGGMGTVFLARDEHLERQVAIKVVAPEVSASPELRQRFIQEARTVAKLRHPNIVAVFAAGEADGLLYFVMEYVPGESLRDRMVRERPMSPDHGVPILRDLALALDYAHQSGVVHRDVKPENVLLDRDTGRAMLTDFGVARALAAGDGRLTGTGFVLGSPKYMSPEQASGDASLDGRSDLYSLGLIGYELFSGAPVVEATTAASMLVKHLTERPQPLRERAPSIAPEIAATIDRVLEKDPTQRFQRGAEFAAALAGEEFAEGTPAWQVGRSGNTTGKRRALRRRKRALPLAGLVTVLAGAAAFFVLQNRNSVNDRAWLVAPFEVQGGDQGFTWLREGSLNMLTASLSQWQDLHVVEYERTLDLLRQENLEDARRVGLDAARNMARRVDAGRLVMGQIETSSDSLIVTANLYDVATGKRIDGGRAAALKGTDPRAMFSDVASQLLDLVGAPRLSLDLAQQTTTSVTAYRHYLEGLRHLNGWRLRSADTAFNHAIEADSTFSLAYYKKSVGMGWESLYDSTRLHASEKSVEFANRLPPRQQELVRGHHELTLGFFAQQRGDTLTPVRNFLAARDRLAKLVASDSTDAEAWYALSDANYHLVWGTRYGSSLDTVGKYLTESMHGFQRTIRLDPSFHLAYSHLVEIYQSAALTTSGILLVNDTVKAARQANLASIGTPEQIARYRDLAREKARTAATGWVAMDPDAVRARQTLANIYAALGQADSGVSVLRAAMRRPSTADPSIEWQLPLMMTRAGMPDAGLELKRTMSRYSVNQIKQQSFNTRVTGLFSAMTVGAASGMPSLIDTAASTLQRTDSLLPGGAQQQSSRFVTQWLSTALKITMGVPMTPAMRNTLVAGIRDIDATAPAGDYTVPYMLYLETGDTLFMNTAVRWANVAAPGMRGFPELQAYAALQNSDTATAARLAREFPSADSIRKATLGMNGVRIAVRASVLAQLGDVRGAIALYEAIDPKRFASGGSVEYGWPFYVRSFAARGKLYEELGDRDKAIASYERFIELWKNAEEPVLPQVRNAKQAVARLKEQSSVPVKRG